MTSTRPSLIRQIAEMAAATAAHLATELVPEIEGPLRVAVVVTKCAAGNVVYSRSAGNLDLWIEMHAATLQLVNDAIDLLAETAPETPEAAQMVSAFIGAQRALLAVPSSAQHGGVEITPVARGQ